MIQLVEVRSRRLSFIKFCIAGAINTSINILTMYILLIFNISILFSSAIGFCAGAVSGFTLNFFFTFNAKDKFTSRLSRYLVIQIFCLIITLSVVTLLSLRLSVYPLIAQFFAIILTTVINYNLSKKLVFEKT